MDAADRSGIDRSWIKRRDRELRGEQASDSLHSQQDDNQQAAHIGCAGNPHALDSSYETKELQLTSTLSLFSTHEGSKR